MRNLKGLFSKLTLAPERIYLVIALVGVVGFAILTPPFQGPDEEAHFKRLLYITHGYLLPIDVTKNPEASLPVSVESVIRTTLFADDLRGDTNRKYELFRTLSALRETYSASEKYQPVMVPYSPVPYLPAIPFVALANLANQSPLAGMYLARFSLGVFSVMLLYFAIRIIPSKKYLLLAVGLLPMLLFQQAMVSADGVSYSLLALFFAYVLYLYSKVAPQKKEYMLLAALMVLLVFSKTLLYLFLPLVLVLWNKVNARKWVVGSLLVSVSLIFLWSTATSSLITNPVGVDSASQMHELKESPLRWARVLWNTYMTSYGDGQTRGIIGLFGYADTAYPLWITMVCFALVVVAGLFSFEKEGRQRPATRYGKWLAVILCATYFFAVNLAMYLNFSPVGSNIIYGVQGRYFLPIVLTLAFIFAGSGIRVDKETLLKLKVAIVVGFCFCLAVALFVVMQRYYLYTP